MKDLTVTLVQSDIIWQNPSANLEAYAQKISSLKADTDLIILPEMFTTGFTMDAETHAESMDGPTMNWIANQADLYKVVIMGSLIIKEGSDYFNRLIWMHPGGMYHTYDKRHLFAMAGEHESYTAGDERLIIEYKGWKICPMICYDLRFPVWARNDNAYDLLIYTANWPNRRSYDWLTLLKARALENQSFTIGVNRVGTDANGHEYNGDSCIIDPGWNQIIFHRQKSEMVHTAALSADHLQKVRSSLPFLKDRDKYKIL